jgi:DNA-directed RNA polymerase subunit RPC12/RpoP
VTRAPAGARIVLGLGKEVPIFDSIGSSPLDDFLGTGFIPGSGTYFCLGCGSQLEMHETEQLPQCPRCGGSRFRRDSIFEPLQDHGEATVEFLSPTPSGAPAWLSEARSSLTRAGNHLAYRDEDEAIQTVAIERGWTRIGRSPASDLCLDDPSVSHRHALLVAEPGKELRVLDDRSLNGVFVNGEPIEWGTIDDGDELGIGRFQLYLLRS